MGERVIPASPAKRQERELTDAGQRSRWESARLLLTGLGMGSADVVPGVSGGTIALISGIYEELVRGIRTVTGPVLQHLLRGRIREAVRETPLPFFVPLGIGMLAAIFTLANLLSWLLDNHPLYLWAFFFGLVGASVAVVGRRVKRWTLVGVGLMAVVAAGAFVLMGLTPTTTPDALPLFFVSGAIAICAMILPGISGAFLLIIMGKYQQMLDAVVDRDVLTLGVFVLGALLGIALFSRLLSWLFLRYHDLVLFVLAGLMLGSMRRLWPWKEAEAGGSDLPRWEAAMYEANVWPGPIDETVALAAGLMAVGAGLVLFIDRLQRRSDRAILSRQELREIRLE
jgi:putative membrane protein